MVHLVPAISSRHPVRLLVSERRQDPLAVSQFGFHYHPFAKTTTLVFPHGDAATALHGQTPTISLRENVTPVNVVPRKAVIVSANTGTAAIPAEPVPGSPPSGRKAIRAAAGRPTT